MGKKRRGHVDVEELLGRPWCYYCMMLRPPKFAILCARFIPAAANPLMTDADSNTA